MKTTRLAFIIAATCAAHTYGGDAKVTLSSTDGSSAFLVRDSASNVLPQFPRGVTTARRKIA